MRIVLNLALALCLESAVAADLAESIPPCLARAGSGYTVSHKLAPHALQGDFDGDGKPDLAVLVTRGREQGVVVCRGGTPPASVLGAGIPFNEMKDLDFTAWRIHPASRKVGRGATARRPPSLAGDALYLEWESASAIVYWNGKRFAWYQQGD
ncbi:MAG: hypothetical protein ACRD8O_16575 [Bryobacteraceae bacterium]